MADSTTSESKLPPSAGEERTIPKDSSFDETHRLVDSEKPDGEFVFSYDDFQTAEDDANSFTIDGLEQRPAHIQHFVELINNPCFDYKGKSPAELFRIDPPLITPEEAFASLTKESPL